MGEKQLRERAGRPSHTRHCTLAAVILAAGEGQRLREVCQGRPKPLVPLLGLTLLQRAILSCRQAGITRFYVVVGYGKEAVAAHAHDVARRYGVSVQVVENPHWTEGNGTSALAVAACLEEPFVLLMADHLFDPVILRALVDAEEEEGTCLLAVDRATDQIFDLEEATKVRLEGRTITAIGKDLDSFDAVDTGLFLCWPTLFPALEEARCDGDGSLAGGIRRLIEREKMRAVDVSGHFWVDVDTPAGLTRAEKLLLSNLSKPHGDGFISRHLNRPLSRRISAWMARTPLTPNVITVLSFLVALTGAFLFTLAKPLWTFLAGIAVHLASVVDGCDGEIARLKFQSSRFGAWFDTVLDRYADVAIVGGISYGYWRSYQHPLVWLGGILALTGFVMYSYTKKEYQVRYGQEMPASSLYGWVPASRDVRLFLVFVGALLNHPFEAVILAGLLAHLSVVMRFVAVSRVSS